MKLEAGKTYVFKDDAAREEYIKLSENAFNSYYKDGFKLTEPSLNERGWVGGCLVISPIETRLFKEKESKPFDISEYEFSDKSISMDSSGNIEVEYESFQGHQDGWSTECAYAKLNKQDVKAIAKHFKLI